MSISLSRRVTGLTSAVILVLGFGVALTSAAPAALAAGTSTAPSDSSIVAICADGTVTMPTGYSSPATCESMADAIAAYASTNGSVTWRLLPGEHCPFTVPQMHGNLNIVGVPWDATVSPGLASEFSGTEVQSVTITPNASGSCSLQNGADIYVGIESQYDHLQIRNLTLDGQNQAQYGYYAYEANFVLRDLLIENNSDGAWFGGWSYGGEGAEIDNTAIVKNATGVYNMGDGAITNTLIADNTTVGIYDRESSSASDALELTNDTITDNNAGISLYSSDGPDISNTILAGNHRTGSGTPSDCADNGYAVGWWASSNGKSKSNLFGASCSIANDPGSVQLPDANDTIGSVNYSGFEPFVWAPSSPQITTVSGWCSAFDQAEQARNGNCPVGALAASGPSESIGGGPSVSDLINFPSSANFDAPVGQQTAQAVQISNKLDGYVTASGASVSGPFTISQDSCTWSMMLNVLGYNDCTVTVRVSPAAATTYSGTLTIHTSAGDVNVPLTAHGVLLPPSAPQDVTMARDTSTSIAVSWNAPNSVGSGTAIASYGVLLRDDTTGAFLPVATASAAQLSASIDGAMLGHSYSATVWAVNDATSEPSAAGTASGFLFTLIDPDVTDVTNDEGTINGQTPDGQVLLSAHGSANDVQIGRYASDPLGIGSAGSTYYYLAADGSFGSGSTLTFCDVPGGATGAVKYFDPSRQAYVDVQDVSIDGDNCSEVQVGDDNNDDTFVGEPVVIFEGATTAGTETGGTPPPLLTGTKPVITDAAHSSSPTVGDTLGVTTGTWPANTTLHYAWFEDGNGVPIGSGAQLVLTAPQAEHYITVTVTGSLSGYQPSGYTSDQIGPIGAVAQPVVAGTPTISDPNPHVGESLTASSSSGWTDGATISYQWFTTATNTPIASGATLTVATGLLDDHLYVQATGSVDGMTSTTSDSATTAAVAPGTLSPQPTPSISGNVVVGSTVTAVPGTWMAGVVLSYRWYVGSTQLTSGGANPTLTIPASAVGGKLTVAVSATSLGYTSAVRTSAPATVAAATLKVGNVTITGTPKVGKTLTSHGGTWTAGTQFTYRWFANGAAIAHATASKLKLTKALRNKKIVVSITGSLAGYTTVVAKSPATAKVRK
jgi:parallel beta-helix repeat protein